MTRGYNFSAGPATLPECILKEAQDEMLEWKKTGRSVIEIGHRTAVFMSFLERTEQQFRDLLGISDSYSVLFLGTAARQHFSMIPMNFLDDNEQGAYIVTGVWSQMAYEEAIKIKKAEIIASSEPQNFLSLPNLALCPDLIKQDMRYVYYTANETVNGIYMSPPENLGLPLVSDMTSCLLSEPLDVSKFGLIFAGAQKNIAPAGLTVVIVRKDLLDKKNYPTIGSILDYRSHAKANSLLATPPIFSIYMAQKMFTWVASQGGVASLRDVNNQKAQDLYQYIDSTDFYYCGVDNQARSKMNVCFSIADSSLEKLFLSKAEEANLYGLKGHRLTGGLRASIYNAMPHSGVTRLLEFMRDFEREHG